ncbi:MAG TPA: universal stress protein [Anaeromyxobacter sp.]|nr:universal stress protein [Anaeromyxobacter sp.]
MGDDPRFSAERILVGVDASAASLDALAAAAALAGRLGARLAGLFVEDEDLLRLAALPFGGVVRVPGGERERLDRASAEASLRAVASHARGALERAAASHRVTWSVQVARGPVVRELLAAAEAADLVVLGAAGHGRRSRGAIGATARAAVDRARASVLLLSRGARMGGDVVAVDDGTPAGALALAAARLLAPEGRPPAIACPRTGGDPAMIDAIARLAPTLVVVPPAAAAPGGAIERILALGIAVLLVRS